MNKTPGLTRCDYPKYRVVGWYTRVYLIDKRIISKFFTDKFNGGKIQAEERAKAWLRLYRSLYRKELPSKVYRKTKQSNNKSGKTGVYFSYTTNRNKTVRYYYWAATWMEKQVPKHRSFYINQFPSKEAACWAAYGYRTLMERKLKENEYL